MKVAISSGSFDCTLAAGDLTQLEWLERCASALGADGIVFERRHFPRTDAEYAAQLRKVSVDLGLVPLAVREPLLLAPETAPAMRQTTIDLATALGATFVLTELPPPGAVPPASFVAAVGAAKAAVRAAKAGNITLLAAAVPGSLAADVPALKHFLKDVDSAWLRYVLAAGSDRSALRARDRALVVTILPADDVDILAEIEDAARPWLLLEGPVCAERVHALRMAAARRTLLGVG